MADTKVTTGKVRLSYANLIHPKKNDQGTDVWSVLLLIPKTDTALLKKLNDAAEAALEIGINKGKLKRGTSLKNAWTTMKDGDERDDLDEAPEYAGHFYMNVNAYRKPGVIDRYKNPIEDEGDIYSGCYARVLISAYAFSVPSNKGITFGLEHVQKLQEGEPLDGRVKVENAFDDDADDFVDDDDEDASGLI